jgi:hypothetical protein
LEKGAGGIDIDKTQKQTINIYQKQQTMKVLQKFLAFLGIASVTLNAENKLDLTPEQQQKIETLGADKERILSAVIDELKSEKLEAELKLKAEEIAALKAEKESGAAKLEDLTKKNDLLSATLEDDAPKQKPTVATMGKVVLLHNAHNEKFAFGIEHDHYSRNKWWNEMAVTKNIKEPKQAEKNSLFEAFNAYSENISERYKHLKDNNLFKQAAAGDIDYTDLASPLGAYYYVRRQDALITYIRKFKSISDIFPRVSNVQDGSVTVDNFFGRSYTQPFQTGKVWAGSNKVAGNVVSVKDVMFKSIFEDLFDLERQYIGYLNREGSDPIKWSFVEWILANCMQIIINEKNVRAVIGNRVEPTSTYAAHYLYGSDGALRCLENLIENNQAWVESSLILYTSSTIYAYVKALARKAFVAIGKGTLQGYSLFMNSLHLQWFLEDYRTLFGTDLDFNGETLQVKNYDIKIQGVVGMPETDYRMWITADGNFETYENVPGEEFKFYTQRDLEALYVTSRFKEGFGAYKPGRKFATQAALQAAGGKDCEVYTNKPYSALTADATTADASVNWYFRTIANSGANAFLGLTNPEQGKVYKLEIGSATNPTNIAQAANFSTFSAAWTPSVVGDFIEFIYNPTNGKYYDFARKVAGTYTKYTSLVAPAYVETI